MKVFFLWCQTKIIFIDSYMEDSRNALFVEPGAYIMRHEKNEKSPKKIVFQEPYESLPNYHMNEIDCNKCKGNSPKPNTNTSMFNFSNLSPLLSILGGSGLGAFGEIFSSSGGGFGDLISKISSNPNLLSNILGMFTNKSNKEERDCGLKKSDLEIKNYTKIN